MTRFIFGVTVFGAFFLPLAGAEGAQPKHAKHDMAALFKKLDTNNDGKLTRDEFMKLPEVLGRKPTAAGKHQQMLAKLFDRLDADGNGTLSLEEFRKLPEVRREMKAARAKPTPPADTSK
jgi:Ca2+-binding EF-hand superfamily protein